MMDPTSYVSLKSVYFNEFVEILPSVLMSNVLSCLLFGLCFHLDMAEGK